VGYPRPPALFSLEERDNFLPVLFHGVRSKSLLQTVPNVVNDCALNHSVDRFARPLFEKPHCAGCGAGCRRSSQKHLFLAVTISVGEQAERGKQRHRILIVDVTENPAGKLAIDRGGRLPGTDHWCAKGINLMNWNELAFESPRCQERERSTETMTSNP